MVTETIVQSDEWSIGEATEYLNGVEGVEAKALHNSIYVNWPNGNRSETFKHLAERGWVVTSADGRFDDDTVVWFERVDIR